MPGDEDTPLGGDLDGGTSGGGALSASFQLTHRFLQRHPRYRETLSLTPEHHRFDPVLWHSSTAALRGLLRAVAEEEGMAADEETLDRAVTNLIEGVVRASQGWDDQPPE